MQAQSVFKVFKYGLSSVRCQVAAAPQAYKVLYAFLVRWGGYQQAAVAMLGLARRLRAEGPAGEATVEEVQHGYGKGAGCLLTRGLLISKRQGGGSGSWQIER